MPVVGLLLFAGVSFESFQRHPESQKTPSRYFWWSATRLDSDPHNRHASAAAPCNDTGGNCTKWDPEYIWIDPGLLTKVLMLSALPAFPVGMFAVRGLGRIGVSEVSSFMVLVPVLIAAWYYVVGWLIDRWIYKRQQSS